MEKEVEEQFIVKSPQRRRVVLKRRFWRIANGVMAIFFSIAMALQMNDPDPEVWMPLYGIIALICSVVVMQPSVQGYYLYKCILTTYLFIISIISCYHFLINSVLIEQLNDLIDIEQGREFCGLFIVLSWLLMMLLVSVKMSDELSPFSMVLIFYVMIGPFVATYIYYDNIDIGIQKPHCRQMLQMVSSYGQNATSM